MGKNSGVNKAVNIFWGIVVALVVIFILLVVGLGAVVIVAFLIAIFGVVAYLIYKFWLGPWQQKKNEREKAESLVYFQTDDIDHLTGEGFEELLRNVFTILGYNAQITKKTGDQGADLILSKDGRKISVQAKRYSKTVGNKAIQEVYSSIQFYETEEAWVITTSDFTKGAIELARKTGVKLYNRYETINLIKKAHAEIKKRKT